MNHDGGDIRGFVERTLGGKTPRPRVDRVVGAIFLNAVHQFPHNKILS